MLRSTSLLSFSTFVFITLALLSHSYELRSRVDGTNNTIIINCGDGGSLDDSSSEFVINEALFSTFEKDVARLCFSRNERICKPIFDEILRELIKLPSISMESQTLLSRIIAKTKGFAEEWTRLFSLGLSRSNDSLIGMEVDANAADLTRVTLIANSHNNMVDHEDLSHLPLLLLVSHFAEDLSWLSEVNTPFIIASKSIQGKETLFISENKGNEVAAYLTFIVKYYHKLPSRILFLHGHRTHWHQYFPVAFIIDHLNPSLQYQNVNNLGFVASIREAQTDRFKDLWSQLFEAELGAFPSLLFERCCGQFSVSRERILLHPQKFYQDLLDYTMINDTSLSNDGYHFPMSYTMEYLWHFIFGEPAYVPVEVASYGGLHTTVDSSTELGRVSYFL